MSNPTQQQPSPNLSANKTPQDFGKARMWMTKAAMAGDSEAERDLGQIFALGMGVPADPVMAYAWYENAALRGDGFAERLRDDVMTHMSPAEVSKGEQEAKTLSAQIKPETH